MVDLENYDTASMFCINASLTTLSAWGYENLNDPQTIMCTILYSLHYLTVAYYGAIRVNYHTTIMSIVYR